MLSFSRQLSKAEQTFMDATTIQLGTLDYVIFFGTLIGAILVGMWAGRKEDTLKIIFWLVKAYVGSALLAPF